MPERTANIWFTLKLNANVGITNAILFPPDFDISFIFIYVLFMLISVHFY
jgi:hypothetical protein